MDLQKFYSGSEPHMVYEKAVQSAVKLLSSHTIYCNMVQVMRDILGITWLHMELATIFNEN